MQALCPPSSSKGKRAFCRGAVALACAVFLGAGSVASHADDAPELAKQAQNPIAHLISVPFQNNVNFGVGPQEDPQYVLNIQPVIPFKMTENWNLITRTIIPVIYQPELAPGVGRTGGLGDAQLSLFFSPAHSGRLIWGVGPVFAFPTANKDILGSGKYSVGASVVALTVRGAWVVGGLINNITSIGGKADRHNVNQMLFQPFVNYNLPRGWYLTTSPVITANWKSKSDDQWTVPVGGGVGRVFKIGKQAINTQFQAFDNVVHPDEAAEWSVRLQFQLLYPK